MNYRALKFFKIIKILCCRIADLVGRITHNKLYSVSFVFDFYGHNLKIRWKVKVGQWSGSTSNFKWVRLLLYIS